MHPLPDSQNPDSLVEVCRLLSPSGFYPLVSGLLPPHYHLFTLWIAGASIWVSVFPSRWDFPRGTPYLLGQIGLVGNALGPWVASNKDNPYLLGQIGLVGNERSNERSNFSSKRTTLPIRSNRISWKPLTASSNDRFFVVPYLLGQIGLVGHKSV